MSLHPVRVPSRDEVVAASSEPIPKSLKTMSLVLAVIGCARLRRRPVRRRPIAPGARSTSTGCSSRRSRRAGVMFVAVQRITTARWSRAVIRFMEGYVAFLPVAFVFLLLTCSSARGHIFPWTHEAPPDPGEGDVLQRRRSSSMRDIVVVRR